MIRLEHINLVVVDIHKSKAFYQTAFPHWQVRGEGGGEWFGKPRRWVHIGDDYSYITLNNNGEGENRDLSGHQTGLAHFAFEVSDIKTLTERLSSAGYQISNHGADEPFRRNVYFRDPDGFEVEFVEYLSDVPAERNFYR